jgi:hypothetical protein
VLNELWLISKISSKRTGLQKAVHQVEEAIRKSQTQDGDSQTALPGLDLHEILNKTRNIQADIQVDSLASDLVPAIQYQQSFASSGHFSGADEANRSTNAANNQSLDRHAETGDLADAENPLQLLAQTSELLQASDMAKRTITLTSVPQAMHLNGGSTFAAKPDGIARFFGRFRPRLDVDPDLDPIEVGLITLSEADTLFDLYDGPYLCPQL